MDSIAFLEITVSKLEQEMEALQYQLSQERNERRLAEYRIRHFSCPASSLFNFSPAHQKELVFSLDFTLKSTPRGSMVLDNV